MGSSQQPPPKPPPRKLPPKPSSNFVPRTAREVVASASTGFSTSKAVAPLSFPITTSKFLDPTFPPAISTNIVPTGCKAALRKYPPRPPGPCDHEDWAIKAKADRPPMEERLPLRFTTIFVQRGDMDDTTRLDYETRAKNLGATVVRGDVSAIPRCVPGCYILVFPQTMSLPKQLIRRYFVSGRKYIVEEDDSTVDKSKRIRNAWKDSVLEIEREPDVRIPSRCAVSLANAGCEALVAKYARIDDPLAEAKRLRVPQDANIGEHRFFLRDSYHQVVDAVGWLEDIEERHYNPMKADFVSPAFEVVGRWVPMNPPSTSRTPPTATSTTPTPSFAPVAPAHTMTPLSPMVVTPGRAPSPLAITLPTHGTPVRPVPYLPLYNPLSSSSSFSSCHSFAAVDMDSPVIAASLLGLAPPPLPMHDQQDLSSPSPLPLPVHEEPGPSKGGSPPPKEAVSSPVPHSSPPTREPTPAREATPTEEPTSACETTTPSPQASTLYPLQDPTIQPPTSDLPSTAPTAASIPGGGMVKTSQSEAPCHPGNQPTCDLAIAGDPTPGHVPIPVPSPPLEASPPRDAALLPSSQAPSTASPPIGPGLVQDTTPPRDEAGSPPLVQQATPPECPTSMTGPPGPLPRHIHDTAPALAHLNSAVTLPPNGKLPRPLDLEVCTELHKETSVAPQSNNLGGSTTIDVGGIVETSGGEPRPPPFDSSLPSSVVDRAGGKILASLAMSVPVHPFTTAPSTAAAGASHAASVFLDSTRGGPLKFFLAGCSHALSASLKACGAILVTDTADRPDAIIVTLKGGETIDAYPSLPRFGGFLQPQIVDAAWVHRCIDEDQLVDYTPYLLEGSPSHSQQRHSQQPQPRPLFSPPIPTQPLPATATVLADLTVSAHHARPSYPTDVRRGPSGDGSGKRKTALVSPHRRPKRPRRSGKDGGGPGPPTVDQNLPLFTDELASHSHHAAPQDVPGSKDEREDESDRDPLDCISEGESELSDSPPEQQEIPEPVWIQPQHRQSCLDLLHDIEQSGKTFLECWPDLQMRSYGPRGKTATTGKTLHKYYKDYIKKRVTVPTPLASDIPEPEWISDNHRLPTLAMVDALLAIEKPLAQSFTKWSESKFGPVGNRLVGTHICKLYLDYINKRVPHRLQRFNTK